MPGLMQFLDEMSQDRVASLDTIANAPENAAITKPLMTPTPTWAPEEDQQQGDSTMQKYAGLMQFLGSQGGGGGGGGGAPADDFIGKGSPDDPWGVDPDGYDPMTRHGVTLDEEAMHSLIAARRAGYNPFPFIGGSYRSIEASDALHDARYDANGNKLPGVLPAAPGGHSMHNFGLAFDAGSLPQRIAQYLYQNGWFNGASFGDPVHYSYYRKG